MYFSKLLEKPIVEVDLTLGGVNEANFESMKPALRCSVANTLGVTCDSVTLSIETDTLKRSVQDEITRSQSVIKASVEVSKNVSEDKLTTSLSDSDSFRDGLNKEIQQNDELSTVQAAAISEPVITEEAKGTYIAVIFTHICASILDIRVIFNDCLFESFYFIPGCKNDSDCPQAWTCGVHDGICRGIFYFWNQVD